MADVAKYLIVQYVDDPFKRESKNLGVIVQKNGVAAARFLGEGENSSKLDLRRVRSMSHPDIYKQWVAYWREQVENPGDDLVDRLMENNGGNYNAIDGGEVADTGSDSAKLICDYLYKLLVIPPPEPSQAVEEIENDEPETSSKEFKADIDKEFRKREIMGATAPSVIHPIWSYLPVEGRRATHTPSYMQQNGQIWVMDKVNFLTPKRSFQKDHAGWIAKMFDDIRLKNTRVSSIALIRADNVALTNKTVKYAIDLLRDSCSLVNWVSPDEQQQFLRERELIARAGPSIDQGDVTPGVS